MSKFYGKIGYGVSEEENPVTAPGVWTYNIVEKDAFGELLKNTIRSENSNNANNNVRIANQISIIADPYSLQNFHLIKYVKYMGIRWSVTEVSIEYPRLIMTLGGEYNGE